jgi:hypothetical protein
MILELQRISLLFEIVALLMDALDGPLLGPNEVVQCHSHVRDERASYSWRQMFCRWQSIISRLTMKGHVIGESVICCRGAREDGVSHCLGEAIDRGVEVGVDLLVGMWD